MKSDGSIAVWGHSDYGGSGAPSSGTYVNIFPARTAFAAIKSDGSITAWGLASEGGSGAPTAGTYVTTSSTIRAFAIPGATYAYGPEQRDYTAIVASYAGSACDDEDAAKSLAIWTRTVRGTRNRWRS